MGEMGQAKLFQEIVDFEAGLGCSNGVPHPATPPPHRLVQHSRRLANFPAWIFEPAEVAEPAYAGAKPQMAI